MKTTRKTSAGLAALLIMAGACPAVAQESAPAPQPSVQKALPPANGNSPLPEANLASYALGIRDVIQVAVVGRDDYKLQAQVQEDGTVPLPLIGPVAAAGRTPAELQKDVQDRLMKGGYFLKPQVVVTLVNVASHYATLLGEVGSPGLVPLDREYRLSEIIARVGGAKPGADSVTMTTPAGVTSVYSLRAIATNASADPIVPPGAKIYLKPAELFYIYGQIGAPGSYPLEQGETVRQALARGGGLTQLGSSRKVKLYRDGKTTERVDLDTKIKPGDTLFIGERFF